MKAHFLATALLGAALITGCSGSSDSTGKSTITGKVADGYLVNAEVFLDKNANYQRDADEPFTVTGADGSFTLTIDPADKGKYPIVVLAIAGQTIDNDTKAAVASTYVLSMHALSVTSSADGALSGTVDNFISPVSTLIRETLVANPGMTLADAVVQVRNQLGFGTDIDIRRDYIFNSLSSSTNSHHRDFRRLHTTAQVMAGLMGEHSNLVITGQGRGVNHQRYREMMGQISTNLPQIADGVRQNNYSSAVRPGIRTKIDDTLRAVRPDAPFRNLSSVFTCYTSQRVFWTFSGGSNKPRSPHHK